MGLRRLGEHLRHDHCTRPPLSQGEPPPSRGGPPPLFLCQASAVLGRASAISERASAVLGTASAIIPSSFLFEGELAHTPYGLPQQYASMFISSPATWISGSGTTSSCRYLLVWLYLPRHLTVAIIYLAVVPIFFSPVAHKITSIQCQYNSQTISTETDFIDANHFFTDPSYMEQTTIEIN